jgi:heterodisulfide reductase subunit A
MGVAAINFVDRGSNRKVDTPFEVHSDICQTCGACAFICPTGAIKLEDITKNKPIPIASEFDAGLVARSPIYLSYPQAVPNVPVIDRDTCIHFLTDECGICQEFCEAEAIDFRQEDEEVDIDVGAVILAPGFDEFDASMFTNYGYGTFPNVLTSIEFERILSASGPFRGLLRRPSDNKVPKSIAWIQCVGSRDKHVSQIDYCSSVCCTYAIKEAVVAQEHSSTPLETTIFLMDIRTFGKGFERYYERAKEEHGVRFIRSRIHSIFEDSDGDLIIRYFDEDRIKEEKFGLVVLSVGLRPPAEVKELAQKVGLELNQYGFCRVGDFSPVATSKPGVFTAGVFAGPKDIPETVMDASAAATDASLLLAPARYSLTAEKEYPLERDVTGEKPRIGVFVCHCGINIGGVVDVPSVKDYARSLPNVAYVEEDLFTCSQDTQLKIKEKIEEHGLNRIVVASCTPRTHEPVFQETLREAGLNQFLFEMAKKQRIW